MSFSTASMPSPCMGVCTIGGDGACVGCLRTLAEIAAWPRMSNEQRLHLLRNELPQRERERERLAALPALLEHDQLHRALYPLAAPPAGAGWNNDELRDLPLPDVLSEAAVLVGLTPRAEGTQVLLTRRTDGLRNHGGQVSFPGGRIDESDIGAVAAALRETEEEIAVSAGQIVPLGFLDPLVTISGYRVLPVVAMLDPGYRARPNPAEVAEVFEVPLQYLMSPQHLRGIAIDFKGRRRTVLEYDWPGQRIWGATAAILSNLRQRLETHA
ncbi:MAG: CoA pyrophosphatase [Pseudoxanthomonas sp.]